jgi:hypothetical protein
MNKLIVPIAALALLGAVADANAFGIVISFGGFHRHHVGRHYGSARRHHSETRTASRHQTTKPKQREAKAAPAKINPANHYSGKDEVPAMAQALSGEQKAADAAWQIYMNLPIAFRNVIGPVAISTFSNIGDYRRIRQAYDAEDGYEGYTYMVPMKDINDRYCSVNLMPNPNVPNELPAVLVHELGHCIDFRNNLGHSMPVMEAFFLDSTKETKEKLIKDGFGYFTTEPQEAFAQAISHYLVPSVRVDYAKWEADWPHLNAQVRQMLEETKIAYLDPKTETPVKVQTVKTSVPVAPLDY